MDLPSAVARQKGKLVICNYTAATANVGVSTVYTLSTAAGARKEMRAEVKARESVAGKPRRVSGPWNLGYQLGKREIFVVKGRYIFHLAYAAADPSRSTLRQLSARAARQL
jgi:hypothetical protein